MDVDPRRTELTGKKGTEEAGRCVTQSSKEEIHGRSLASTSQDSSGSSITAGNRDSVEPSCMASNAALSSPGGSLNSLSRRSTGRLFRPTEPSAAGRLSTVTFSAAGNTGCARAGALCRSTSSAAFVSVGPSERKKEDGATGSRQSEAGLRSSTRSRALSLQSSSEMLFEASSCSRL
jgi:hypothetical protein